MKFSNLLILVILLNGAAALPSLAEDQPNTGSNVTETVTPQKVTSEEVRKEVREAIQAIKSYSADSRDEAIKKAKAALENFDARIKEAERRQQQERAQAIAQLKERRKQVAKHYQEMKRATKQNWEKAKTRFLKDYREMENEYEEKVSPFLAQRESHDTSRIASETR